jgi:double-strand break repair protein AddB
MIFAQSDRPRVFGLPPGADFAALLVQGLVRRSTGLPPEAIARAEVFVNTRRMQRRIREIYDSGPPGLLPRLRLITDLGRDPAATAIAPAVAPLRRRLELAQVVGRLVDLQPDLTPRSATFDLADSLALLMDEMHGEGVSPAAIATLDVSDQSGHWARSQQFLGIIDRYFDDPSEAPGIEARQRLVIESLVAQWAITPPDHPILIAGSTGSRGATALLIEAVARLPQGAVILPGFDFDMPAKVWDRLDDQMTGEDHPQFRFRRLLQRLDLRAADVTDWEPDGAPSPSRNRLISLSLRPAPVTDQWRAEGPMLTDIAAATDGVVLVEAPSPRAEAETIALRLRQAVDDGISAALITPDRMLTRQVAAALDRWNIIPDDSAGTPLALSPPGRFLRHVGGLFGARLTAETLLVLLKHPLTNSSGAARGPHLRRVRDLELDLRENGRPFPTGSSLADWAGRTARRDPERQEWADWLATLLSDLATTGPRPLGDHIAAHIALAEAFAAGPAGEGAGGLWDESAGRKAREVCADLTRHADAGGVLSPVDYLALFARILNGAEVRNPDIGHPAIRFWGTLEARVQGADLMILGGMNDGVWPEVPEPDPWLNRQMRKDAGLLLPERRIGLSAHDYQQAVAGQEVWITRAIRSSDAQTVPSRWVNRLTNLLDGLPEQGGRAALERMRAEGARWVAMAQKVSTPVDGTDPAIRPSPRPPLSARPTSLSVTQIKTLIRDPYAIYAQKVLRLRELNPLTPSPDAPLRGTIVHKVLEQFVSSGTDPRDPAARSILMQAADEALALACPWPTVQRMWLAQVDRFADWFLATEVARQRLATPVAFEAWGEIDLDGIAFGIKGKADRIDRTASGDAILYDYKTGRVPTKNEQIHFDKQLLIEAAMVARGAFKDIGPVTAEAAEFIGLGSDLKTVAAPIDKCPADQVWAELHDLIRRWMQPDRGYSARLALFSHTEFGYFDHLARFGEWDMTSPVMPEVLT